jgi:uncharacterized protein YtpQ (UPF0354 family)
MRAIDRLRRTPKTTDSPLLPVIRPFSWDLVGRCAHRSLLRTRGRAGVPFVAIGRDTGDGLDLLLNDAPEQLGMDFRELEDFAVGNLQLRPAQWQVLHRNEGTGRPVLLGFEGDGVFSASRIVDPTFLAQAHTLIGARLLLAAVPNNRALFVADASPVADRSVHAGFTAWCQRHHHRAEGIDALTPQGFLMRQTELIGFYEPAADE